MKIKEINHGFINNLFFYLKIWKKTFPIGLIFIVLSVPIQILAIYEMIRIPQIMIRGVEMGSNWYLVIHQVVWAFVIMTMAKVCKKLMETKLMTRGSRPLMWLYSEPVHQKLYHMDYEKLMSNTVQNKLAKVENIVTRGGDGGPIHFFGVKLSGLLVALVGLLLFSPNILRIDGVLLLVIVLSALINLGYSVYAGRYSIRNMRERSEWEKKELYFTKVCEDRSYSKDIRFYDLLTAIGDKFEFYHKKHGDYLRREANVHFGAGLLNSGSLFFRDALAYIYLIGQLSRGSLLVSDFVFLIALVFQFSMWMDELVINAKELISFSSQMEQIRDFLDIDDGLRDGDLEIDQISPRPSIEFSNISYKYPDSEGMIFENFSLMIKPGEKIALVGINGAGKTTLMHILMGLLHPVDGKVLIDGRDSRSFVREEYYRLFSPVFQDICIFPESIAVNIAGENPWQQDRLDLAIAGAGIGDFIDSLDQGIQTKLVRHSQEDAIDLSGGMNQRLLLARALYKDARINILDEPTAALDPLAESKIYEEYDQMSKGKTSIFISHRLASTRFCDRIIFLEGGKILEEGSHEELMVLGGRYAQMYRLQSKYYQDEEQSYEN